MKKAFTFFLALAMILSISVISAGAFGITAKNNTKESGTNSKTQTKTTTQNDEDVNKTSDTDSEKETVMETSEGYTNQNGKVNQDIKKQFKIELNQQKKELQQEKIALNQEKKALENEYEDLLASGDTAGAESVLESINALNLQQKELQTKIKQTINERHMVVKTMYSDAELAQFNSASDLIEQMYADANILDAGSVTANNNIIKFDAPAYIKGGVTLVPLRAISEQLGAEVSWDADSQTVKISKGDTIIEIAANSTMVLVNGAPTEISLPANVTCGRTYLPLRFLAETLDFSVTWDGENEIIDIDDGTNTDTTTNTTEETTSTDTTATDTTSADGDNTASSES